MLSLPKKKKRVNPIFTKNRSKLTQTRFEEKELKLTRLAEKKEPRTNKQKKKPTQPNAKNRANPTRSKYKADKL